MMTGADSFSLVSDSANRGIIIFLVVSILVAGIWFYYDRFY